MKLRSLFNGWRIGATATNGRVLIVHLRRDSKDGEEVSQYILLRRESPRRYDLTISPILSCALSTMENRHIRPSEALKIVRALVELEGEGEQSEDSQTSSEASSSTSSTATAPTPTTRPANPLCTLRDWARQLEEEASKWG